MIENKLGISDLNRNFYKNECNIQQNNKCFYSKFKNSPQRKYIHVLYLALSSILRLKPEESIIATLMPK